MKNIIIASDHGGFILKEQVRSYLSRRGYNVKDLGAYSQDSCDYPEFAYELAKAISERKFKRGILICKTGIGNSIVANKLPGVRAALCYNAKAAKLSREHNDSNILVLGSLFVDEKLARKISMIWLNTEFCGGRHKRRVGQIREIEKRIGGVNKK